MPESLKRQLARIALDEGRSENAVMVDALQRYVRKRNAAQSGD
jgi:predicted transcriptional regulator